MLHKNLDDAHKKRGKNQQMKSWLDVWEDNQGRP